MSTGVMQGNALMALSRLCITSFFVLTIPGHQPYQPEIAEIPQKLRRMERGLLRVDGIASWEI